MENFNVGNPTKENIEYAFKNLIFYVTGATKLDIYKGQKNDFEKVLVEINEILALYLNNETLITIEEQKLQNIKFDLIDLDRETKPLKSYYAEWALQWFEAIMSLRISEVKLRGVDNGR